MKLINPFKNRKKSAKANISTPIVHVIIKRFMENNPVIIATFDCMQDKEHGFNPVLVNADEEFKEEIEFIEEQIIQHYKHKLDLSNVPNKVDAVKSKIAEQEVLIKGIRDGKSGNQEYNIIDEEQKLNVYKALLFSVQNAGDGSFEVTGIDGIRIMEFASINGTLFPIFHNATKLTTHPSIVTKKKHHREEQFLIDLERQEELSNPWGTLFTNILKMAIPVLIVILLILVNNVNNKALDVDSRIMPYRDTSEQCLINLAQCRGDFMAGNCSIDYNDAKYDVTVNTQKNDNAELDKFLEFTDKVTGQN